ncbi:MAG: helix-turn-helix domain-containing protein [Solirubrobacterales bacterium]
MNYSPPDDRSRAALPDRPWEELPSELSERLRPHLDALAEELIEAIREGVPSYRRPLEGEFGAGLKAGVAEALAQFLDLIRDGGSLSSQAKQRYVDFGRWEAREGRRLESLLSAYRLGARISWRRIAESIRGAELGEETVARLAESVFAHIDELSAASAEGFAAELADRAGERDRRRRRLLSLLIQTPPADPAVIRDAAGAAGWDLPSSLAALIYRPGSPDRVAAHLPPGSLAAAIEEVAIALIPDPSAPGRRSEIARALHGRSGELGTPVAWESAGLSVERAQALRRIREVGLLSADGLLAADDHLAALLTLGDLDLLEDLAERRLAPLAELTAGARERLELTLLAWLDHQGVVKEAADALNVHPQTVRYRVAQLRELFGPGLDEPEARYELLLVLRARRAHAALEVG